MSFVRPTFAWLLKETIWSIFNLHRQGTKRDIWLAGSRRSGTTLLMQVLAANPGVKSLNQPLGLYAAPFWLVRQVPVFEAGRYLHLDAEDAETVKQFVSGLREGRFHINEPWMFWKRGHPFRSDRLVFKEIACAEQSEWAEDELGCSVIFLVRHPIPQSRSVERNGWPPTAKAYLRNEHFVSKHMTASLHAKCWDIYNKGSTLERHVLSWTLENITPLRALDRRASWYFVTYEEFTMNREEVISEWSQIYGLPDVQRMNDVATRGSYSAKYLSERSTLASISKDEREFLVSAWRRKIPADDERRAMSILELFGLDIYRCGDWRPTTLRRRPAALAEARRQPEPRPRALVDSGET